MKYLNMKKSTFNQKEYIKQYNKKNYIQFKVYITKEEKQLIEYIKEEYKLKSNKDFIKKAIDELE